MRDEGAGVLCIWRFMYMAPPPSRTDPDILPKGTPRSTTGREPTEELSICLEQRDLLGHLPALKDREAEYHSPSEDRSPEH